MLLIEFEGYESYSWKFCSNEKFLIQEYEGNIEYERILHLLWTKNKEI